MKKFILVLLAAGGCASREASVDAPPNVIILFTDNQGYGDVGCFGATDIATPNLDRMAREGMKFTDFYVPQAACTASRAAIMTGCYPNRIGVLGALFPDSETGLSHDETTVAEILKARGYATACIGKWHLGDKKASLPTRHGFDEYFGIPYSVDIAPTHPRLGDRFPPLPLYRGETVIERNPDLDRLNGRWTKAAVEFIRRNRERPFFLYLPHSSPHVPLHVGKGFQGRSKRGRYGDVIEEVDASTGEILSALKENGIDANTLVIFTSDNGPWLSWGDHGGSPGPLREGIRTCFEGGVRMPCLMRWPARIPAGSVCREPATTMDLLPTLAGLAGGTVPTDRIIDGKDILPLLTGVPGVKSPHEALYFYWNRELHAVRSGRWKLFFPHRYSTVEVAGKGGVNGKYRKAPLELSLFDLSRDPGETTNLADRHKDIVERLKAYGERAREDLGDRLTKREGRNLRPPGRF